MVLGVDFVFASISKLNVHYNLAVMEARVDQTCNAHIVQQQINLALLNERNKEEIKTVALSCLNAFKITFDDDNEMGNHRRKQKWKDVNEGNESSPIKNVVHVDFVI